MKHLMQIGTALFVLWPIVVSSLHAQTLPNSFNYQGRLTDTAGTPLPNGNYQMIFSIWDAATAGNQLWGSGNKTITLAKGLFSTSLGPVPSAVLSGSNTFLQVQMGTDTPMPRIALGAVPYAMKAVELFWPAIASISNANPVLSLVNSGSGRVLQVQNTGTGNGGFFEIANPASGGSALIARTNGTGNAVEASTSGGSIAVFGQTSGAGYAISGKATGNGNAAWFNSTGNTTKPTLVSLSTVSGNAGYFEASGGTGTSLVARNFAQGSAGSFESYTTANSLPSLITTTVGSGPALKATAGTGLAGLFEGTVELTGLKLPTGASSGYVLKSDGSGNATWNRADQLTDLTLTNRLSARYVVADANSVNDGMLIEGGLSFGGNSGEGIYSKRSVGGNQYGLDITTYYEPRISITNTGNVGIRTRNPLFKLHMEDSLSGDHTTPMAYINNTNGAGDTAPALKVGGSGANPNGVLSVLNNGTGKIAAFRNSNAEVACIDTDGNIVVNNHTFVKYGFTNSYTTWAVGEEKDIQTMTVQAPSAGDFVIDGAMQVAVNTLVNYPAEFNLILCAQVGSGSITAVKPSYLFQDRGTRMNQDLTVFYSYPVTKGQTITFYLRGRYSTGAAANCLTSRETSLRVLFVPTGL
ncbi:MAG: autotransporter outer membrane beta-barrel domain-containing protein [Armatimonadota bacterium]